MRWMREPIRRVRQRVDSSTSTDVDRLSGLYIVTLANEEPIGVNANDLRYAETCLRVNRLNCKFGNARNLAARRRNYEAVFGRHNVEFFPIIAMADIMAGERAVLADLHQWRVRHSSGRLHEWLAGIAPQELEDVVLRSLRCSGLAFEQIGTVKVAPALMRER